MKRTIFLPLVFALFFNCVAARAQSMYFPLRSDAHWTLKSPGVTAPVEIAVVGQEGSEYLVRFTSPFGVNEWRLNPRGDRYYLTGFGNDRQLAPLPADTLYFDFGAQVRSRWSNKIGKLEVASRSDSVQTADGPFRDCITISQSGGMSFTFAPGVGPVRFTAGKSTFVLTTKEAPQSLSRGSAPGNVLFSVTPNVFANQPETPDNLLRNLDLVTNTGIGFLIHNGKWNELEPKAGQYDFSGLDFNVATARRLGIPICYTLRVIETVDRATPSDVKKMAWDDPKLMDRLDHLIDAMTPHFQGSVRWFLIGNEIDGYFNKNQKELPAYARLYAHLATRLRQRIPGIQVSSTLMFGGVALMDGFMKPLADQFDFVCFTYYPFKTDFTMREPAAVFDDVARMRAAARGRKVVLQEIGYPSGSDAGSSPARQAEFYRDVFQALRKNSDLVEAGCFWLLADLKPQVVDQLARYYGLSNARVFKSFLQTLGMFDGNGMPKPAWSVYQSEAKR